MSRSQIIASAIALMAFNAVLVIVLYLLPISSPLPEGDLAVPIPKDDDPSVVEAIGPVLHEASLDSVVEQNADLDMVEREVAQFGAQEIDTFTVPVIREGTVREAMREQERTGAVRYEGREYPGLGFFLEAINGVRAEKGLHWFLYINDELSARGASDATVVPGDAVYWRLEANTHY